MAEPLRPGDPRQLGAFYLDGRLGAGGQGVVYEGYGPDGERVAVKALHGVSDRDRDMLRREVSAWRRVAPFCTTKVLHADVDGPVPFVVSEYVAGRNLRQAVQEPDGPYRPEQLRRLAIGLATALVAIHRAGVVHRDLKPENILLGHDGPRVIDFGIAGHEELSSTTGAVKGTLRYMPPERYRGLRGDAKVDVWGWGAVILFAATGRAAFDGETVPVIADQVATHEPDTSVLDEPLRSLVAAALSKDPADRPTSEDLLLGLAGGVNLAETADKAIPARTPEHAGRSRAELAEAVFADLDPAAREALPRVCLRLVAPGERAEDTLRSARRAEFAGDQTDAQAVERVLGDFTRAGILVWEGESVTLASAALIRAWPRLRGWVEAERMGLGVHQGLVGASRLWDGHGRKNSDLLQGTALARAQSWAATGRRHLTLNLVESAFLDAAAMLARRRVRSRTLLSAVLVVLLVIAIGAAAVAVDQRQTVAAQRDRAVSAQVADLATGLRRTDPDLARRLAVAAWSISGTTEAWSALLSLRHQWENKVVKVPDFEAYLSDLDGTGRTLLAAAGTRVGLWDVDTGRRLGSYTAPAGVDRVDISDDGRSVALRIERDQRIVVLDAPGLRPRNGHHYPAAGDWDGGGMGLSPTGGHLAVTGPRGDGKGVAVWDTRTGRRVYEQADGSFLAPSFSPREDMLSLTGRGKVSWIDLATGKKLSVPDLSREGGLTSAPVRFSPDGRKAVLQNGRGGRLVALGEKGGRDLKGPPGIQMGEMRFSHDGRYIASGFTLWEVDGFGEAKPVIQYATASDECETNTIRFSADGSELRCVSSDGVLRSLDIGLITKPPVKEAVGGDTTAASRDGSTLALESNNKVEIWSTVPLAKRFELAPSDASVSDVGLKLSRDGRLLALGHEDKDGEIEIYDLAKKARLGVLPASIPPDSEQGSTFARDLDFSPDNRSLVRLQTERGTAVLKFWDLATMKVIREIRKGAGSVEFRPDGKAVLAAPGPGLLEFPTGRVIKEGAGKLWPSRISTDGRTLFQDPEAYSSKLLTFDAQTMQRKGDGLRTGPISAGGTPVVAHSSDDRLVATTHGTSEATQIKLWDLESRTQLGMTLTGHLTSVSAMTFTPDDSALISVGRYGAFNRYTIAPRPLTDELCSKAGELTKAEWRTRIPNAPYRQTC